MQTSKKIFVNSNIIYVYSQLGIPCKSLQISINEPGAWLVSISMDVLYTYRNYNGQHDNLTDQRVRRVKLICWVAVQFSVILLYKSALLSPESLAAAAVIFVSICVCVPGTGIWHHGPAG